MTPIPAGLAMDPSRPGTNQNKGHTGDAPERATPTATTPVLPLWAALSHIPTTLPLPPAA